MLYGLYLILIFIFINSFINYLTTITDITLMNAIVATSVVSIVNENEDNFRTIL